MKYRIRPSYLPLRHDPAAREQGMQAALRAVEIVAQDRSQNRCVLLKEMHKEPAGIRVVLPLRKGCKASGPFLDSSDLLVHVPHQSESFGSTLHLVRHFPVQLTTVRWQHSGE